MPSSPVVWSEPKNPPNETRCKRIACFFVLQPPLLSFRLLSASSFSSSAHPCGPSHPNSDAVSGVLAWLGTSTLPCFALLSPRCFALLYTAQYGVLLLWVLLSVRGTHFLRTLRALASLVPPSSVACFVLSSPGCRAFLFEAFAFRSATPYRSCRAPGSPGCDV